MKLDRRTFIKASSAVGLTSSIQAQEKSSDWQLIDTAKNSFHQLQSMQPYPA